MERAKIKKILDNYLNYKLPNTKTSKVHNNWKRFYKLRNSINSVSIKRFLDPSSALLYGYNFTKNEKKTEEKSLNQLLKIVTFKNKKKYNFIKKIKPENIYGEKYINIGKIRTTRTITSNASTCYEILDCTKKFNKKISVLEIGPGYGEVARQIIKYSNIKIKSYDFIDLPNSILFCELYLGKIFGTKNFSKSNFVERNSFLPNKKYNLKFNFIIANEINLLKNKYDLIINTYSLGEMPKETMKKYIKIIFSKMHNKSKFISINAVSKWSIKNYNDYNFKIFKNTFTKQIDEFPPSIQGTTSILNVFNRTNIKNKLSSRNTNILGNYLNLGFSKLMNEINGENCNLNNNNIFLKKLSSVKLSNILSKNLANFKPEELLFFLEKCIKGDQKFLNIFKNDFYTDLKENFFFKYISFNTLIKLNSKLKSKMLRKKIISYFELDIIRYNLSFRFKNLINKIFNFV